ncbi:MAG TPA: hypothetical protein VH136_18720 [Trebonia sp.]|jgi:hypothetical protein|nr:hypothetical protein [Trebonia sp.]
MTTPVYELDPAEVQVGTSNGPGLYVAPVGTTPPADTSTAPAAPWEILGYISDDGPTVGSSTTTQDIKPWQSRSPIRTVVTERTMTVKFILWQINEQTLAMYFDADVPTAVAGAFKLEVRTDGDQHLYAIMVDTADGPRAMRVIFHRASLSDAADMQIQSGAAVPLEVTLTALDDAGVLADVLVGPSADVGMNGQMPETTKTSITTGKGASS